MKSGIISTFFKKTYLPTIGKYIASNISTVVFMPPTYEFLDFWGIIKAEKMVDEIIDLRLISFRYPASLIDRIFRYIMSRASRGNIVLIYPEYLFEGYKGIEDTIKRFYISLKPKGVILFTFNPTIYKYLVGIGYTGLEISELGINETFKMVKSDKDVDILDLSEGNLGVLSLLWKHGMNSYILQRYFIDYMSKLESGQRSILYYLSTRISTKGVTERHGAQTYVYLQRLIKNGYVVRLSGRRGNYIVRNPLVRILFNTLFRGEEYYWYANGFLYLVIKMLQSIDRDISISTPTYTIYMSRIRKIKRIDRWNCRLVDERGTIFSIHFTWSEEPNTKKAFPYEEDIKILLYPYTHKMDMAKRLKKSKIVLLDYNDIIDIARSISFYRRV